MRVLQLIKTAVGATWALRQVRELVKLGVEVHVAVPCGPLTPDYERVGATVHPLQPELPVRRIWRAARTLSRLRGLVGDVAPDVIHSHFVGTTLAVRLALGRRHPVPRLFQVPGPLHLEHRMFRALDVRTAGGPDYWIASCRKTRDIYRAAGVPDDRLFLSYYGTDVEQADAATPSRLRASLGVADGARLVGMTAYIYPPRWYLGQRRGLKGHEDLIDALAICRRRDPRIEGVFVGGAWNGATRYEARVRRYAAGRLGAHARFLGPRNDVFGIYRELDVAVHPSHSENVGGAVESLLCGVPTVTTDVGGFPDVIEPGVTGWMVPPKRPDRLAAAILHALDDPQAARGAADCGRARIREMFDVRRTAREIHEIYQDVVRRRLPGGSAS